LTDPIELELSVPCPPAHAFELWTARTSVWWPHSHSVSGDPGLTVTFEPHPGGRVFERTPDGAEHDWGEVVVWEPPERLTYLWHLRQDRADATEVTITFEPGDGQTLVRIVHRGWERLGARGDELRRRNTMGWSGLLPHYTAAISA
jgi:uncharacterized protein YndB with AHSA1/START domain